MPILFNIESRCFYNQPIRVCRQISDFIGEIICRLPGTTFCQFVYTISCCRDGKFESSVRRLLLARLQLFNSRKAPV